MSLNIKRSTFANVLLTNFGLEFASNVMKTTGMPFSLSSASNIFENLFFKVCNQKKTVVERSLLGTTLKKISIGEGRRLEPRECYFKYYCNNIWKIPFISSMPKKIELNKYNLEYEKKSHVFIKILEIINKNTKKDLIISSLSKLSLFDVKGDPIENAKKQFKKYTTMNFYDDISILKKIDESEFPLWFQRKHTARLCEHIRKGRSFNDSYEMTCKEFFEFTPSDITLFSVSYSERKNANKELLEIFEKTLELLKSKEKLARKDFEYVYLAVLSDNIIKIGGSNSIKNLEKRLKTHHSEYPSLKNDCCHKVDSYRSVEKVLKAMFSSKFPIYEYRYSDPKKKSELGRGEYFSIGKSKQKLAKHVFEETIALVLKDI
ncbi:GIY-YIG nuclease family protein [Pseudoalteromonas lipolytica]|uniref:GIY-YIG nuclease family protein n=1 Tax=Pseudoalteromonas lipolytica TaxID=570156 RepID=UPI00309E41DB